MDIRTDLESILPHLPTTFTDADLDRWMPWLTRRHREVGNVRRQLARTLDQMVDDGILRMVEPGVWERPELPDEDPTLELGLEQGDLTDREELADIIGTDGPTPLQRGIFKRADGPFRDELLLFHDPEENPYGDVVDQHEITYVGQGQEGDQKLRSYNRYIAEHLKRGLTVHFFEKEGSSGELRYRGEVVCESYERVYRPEEERSVLEFQLVPFDPVFADAETTPVEYYGDVKGEITDFPAEPRFVDRPERATMASRLVRDVAFRDIVIEAYEKTCAVCGDPIFHDGLTELEAAHIVGVAERGPDEPRNGLALCKRHHWAFDHGVFTVTDEYEVHSFLAGPDPHGELVHGEELHVPDSEERQPHPWYLEYHREKWAAGAGTA